MKCVDQDDPGEPFDIIESFSEFFKNFHCAPDTLSRSAGRACQLYRKMENELSQSEVRKRIPVIPHMPGLSMRIKKKGSLNSESFLFRNIIWLKDYWYHIPFLHPTVLPGFL
jgi:hypothetical protein